MKRIMIFLLILVLLTSCSNNNYGTSDKSCKGGICLSYEVSGPVEALQPTLITFRISSEKDINDLGFSVYIYQNIKLVSISPNTENLILNNDWNEGFYNWSGFTKIKAGEEYIITTYIVLPAPSSEQPYTHYEFSVGVSTPEGLHIGLRPNFYLGQDGKGMTRADAQKLTLVPIGITPVPGGVIIGGTLATFAPTRTPSPEKTQAMILDVLTETPTFTATPTQPAYPYP